MPEKPPFPENILVILRQRKGLDETDTSQDQSLQKLSPAEAVRECTAWELGDPSWANRISRWMRQCGASPQDLQ